MNRYNWKGYDFIGTVPEFAEKFGYCKTPTFVNAIKRVPRHRYNCMDAMEQRVYEEKRKRAKRAYCIYMNEDMTESYIITKEEYLATNLPVREKHHEPFLLSYSNRVLPYNFIGNNHDEIPVKSAMKKYSAEAVKFVEQLLLAAGYFNGISITFDSERSRDGVDNCRLAVIDLDGERIYNGWRRLGSVDEILYYTTINKDGQAGLCPACLLESFVAVPLIFDGVTVRSRLRFPFIRSQYRPFLYVRPRSRHSILFYTELSYSCLPVGMAEYYGAKVDAAVRASRSGTPCLSLQDGGSAQSFPSKPCLVCHAPPFQAL